MKGIVYELVSESNKRYVGSTVKTIKQRILQHNYLLKNNIHHSLALQNAWNKYGHFTVNILEEIDIKEIKDIRLREQYFIDTLKPEYNISRNVFQSFNSYTDEKRISIVTLTSIDGENNIKNLSSDSCKVILNILYHQKFVMDKQLCFHKDDIIKLGLSKLKVRKVINELISNGIISYLVDYSNIFAIDRLIAVDGSRSIQIK